MFIMRIINDYVLCVVTITIAFYSQEICIFVPDVRISHRLMYTNSIDKLII
jgi:hypothetical protein